MDGEQLLKAAKNNLASSLNLLTHLEVKSLQESFFVRQGQFGPAPDDLIKNGERTRALSKLLKKEFNFGRSSLRWLVNIRKM